MPARPAVRVDRLIPSLDGKLSAERAVFISAFMASYPTLAPELFSGADKLAELSIFLSNAFDEEETAYTWCARNGGHRSRFYRATDATDSKRSSIEVAGFLSIDVSEDERSMYIRQLAVSPTHQRRGVARRLVLFALNDVISATTITVAYRKFNTQGRAFYGSLGFQQTADVPQDLDPKQYDSMVLHR